MQWQDQIENQSIMLWLKLLVNRLQVWVMMILAVATKLQSLHKFCCTCIQIYSNVIQEKSQQGYDSTNHV